MAATTSKAILIGSSFVSPLAGVVGYLGSKQIGDAKAARRSQQTLEDQRKKELQDEAAARDAAAERAKTAGQRVGARSRVTGRGSYGFGSGNTQEGLGSGSLFGN